ncbi:MAG: hypothetical protein KAQ97_03050 [Candidatus Fermentibacteraceae bacterium]|nr:hypothetical protein [Candidatus Fermentibacteraceae bacterium]
MRYQVVVLDEEIGSDFNIDSIAWQRHPAGDNSAEFETVKIYMGLCSEDQLGSTFDDNYIEGTRTLIYESSSLVMSGNPDEWVPISLDTNYQYDSSEGNLIIEVTWESCVDLNSFYIRSWDAGTIRAVGYTQAGAPSYPTGSLSSSLPRMTITGTAQGALGTLTFGAVKSLVWR